MRVVSRGIEKRGTVVLVGVQVAGPEVAVNERRASGRLVDPAAETRDERIDVLTVIAGNEPGVGCQAKLVSETRLRVEINPAIGPRIGLWCRAAVVGAAESELGRGRAVQLGETTAQRFIEVRASPAGRQVLEDDERRLAGSVRSDGHDTRKGQRRAARAKGVEPVGLRLKHSRGRAAMCLD